MGDDESCEPETTPPTDEPAPGPEPHGGAGEACPPVSDLPPGFHLITDEQLTMLIQQGVTQEMRSLRETIRADVEREIRGNLREIIKAGVRRHVQALVREHLGEVRRQITGAAREEVNGQKDTFIHGPSVHVVKATATQAVLGGLIHSAVPWSGDKVGGVLTEGVAGAKVERFTGGYYRNAPIVKHFHGSLTTTAVKALLQAPKFYCLARGGEIRRRAAKIREIGSSILMEGIDMNWTTDEVTTKAADEYFAKADDLKKQADEIQSKASKWEQIGRWKVCGGSLETR